MEGEKREDFDVTMNKEVSMDSSSSVKEEIDFEMNKETAMVSSSSMSDSGDAFVQKLPPASRRISGPARRSTKGGWTKEEDQILTKAVQHFKGKNWKRIAELFQGRSDVQCLHRWQKVLNPDLIKGPWTKEEDDCIIELVAKYGLKKWSEIAKSLPGRIGKQCRERWHNHLNPDIKKDAWTTEEEVALIRAHQIFGNKWAEIARCLPGRADNSIKNHWNCSVKKKVDSYFASGLICPLPRMSNTDLSNHLTKGELGKAEVTREISSSSTSFDRKPDPKSGDETCSVGLVPGSAKRVPKLPVLQNVQNENHKCSKGVNNPNPVEEKVSFGSPREVHIHANISDGPCHTPFAIKPGDSASVALQTLDSSSNSDTRFFHPQLYYKHANSNDPSPESPFRRVALPASAPSLVIGTHFPLELTRHAKQKNISSEMVYSVTANDILESSKKPMADLFARNGWAVRDIGLKYEENNTHSSERAGESDEIGEVHANKVPGTSLQSTNINCSPFYNEPLQLTSGDVPSGNYEIAKADSRIQLAKGPLEGEMSLSRYSTTPSHVRSSFLNGSSPQSILRSLARSYKNIPSIISRRPHEIPSPSPLDNSEKVSVSKRALDFVCSNDRRAEKQLKSLHSAPCKNTAPEGCNMDLPNVKNLFVSTQYSSRTKNAAVLKSVERKLVNLFEAEADDAESKSSSTATEGDPSDANPGLSAKVIAVGESNDPQAGLKSLIRNYIQPGSRVAASNE